MDIQIQPSRPPRPPRPPRPRPSSRILVASTLTVSPHLVALTRGADRRVLFFLLKKTETGLLLRQQQKTAKQPGQLCCVLLSLAPPFYAAAPHPSPSPRKKGGTKPSERAAAQSFLGVRCVTIKAGVESKRRQDWSVKRKRGGLLLLGGSPVSQDSQD